MFNPFTPKSDLIDFTLSNARRFYSSKGDPLGVKGLKDDNKMLKMMLRSIQIHEQDSKRKVFLCNAKVVTQVLKDLLIKTAL